ncbi:Hypothetical protein AT6N2_L2291 [Agrobacterium tumefaciens]|nr:Hypothetical protein AT6N2_L2291 [Agrobacterium tumefaciens]
MTLDTSAIRQTSCTQFRGKQITRKKVKAVAELKDHLANLDRGKGSIRDKNRRRACRFLPLSEIGCGLTNKLGIREKTHN